METRGNGPGLDEPVGFGPVASRGLFSDGLMEKLHFFPEKVLFTPLNLWPSPSFLPGLENRPNWVLRVLILGNLPLWPGLKAVSSHLMPHRRHAAFMTWHGPTCQVPPHQHPHHRPLPIRFPIPLSFPNPRNPSEPHRLPATSRRVVRLSTAACADPRRVDLQGRGWWVKASPSVGKVTGGN